MQYGTKVRQVSETFGGLIEPVPEILQPMQLFVVKLGDD